MAAPLTIAGMGTSACTPARPGNLRLLLPTRPELGWSFLMLYVRLDFVLSFDSKLRIMFALILRRLKEDGSGGRQEGVKKGIQN